MFRIQKATPFVNRKQLLRGVSSGPFQLYVLARDGKWYLQKPALRRGGRWFVYCTFGDESTPLGAAYTVAAVAGDDRPHSPVDELPAVLATAKFFLR